MDYDYYEDRPVDAAVEHRRRINAQIHERYRIRDTFDPLNLSITEFVRVYRVPQDAAVDLCNIIRPYLPPRRSPQHTALIRRFLVALSFLAQGSYQRLIGRSVDCSVSQSSVSRFIREIVLAFNHPAILTRFLRFPLTHEERAPIIARNERMGLPRVLGFVDCWLLRLNNLLHNNDRQAFWSRKGWTGTNNQIICDADLNIMNIDARYPGSVNDQAIWNASTAREVVEQAYWEERCWLLGDSGYNEEPWLHTPILHAAEGTPEHFYTQLHVFCRNCVERCIGVLRARWRILNSDRCIHYRCPTFAGQIVNACCVLHNYCNTRRLPLPPPVLVQNDPHFPDFNDLPLDIHQRGIAERNFLVNYAYERHLQRGIVNAL